jgi:HD superfamily phosphohydrolase
MKFPIERMLIEALIEKCAKVSEENVHKLKEKLEFPDVRSCEIWLKYSDGSETIVDAFLNMDLSIEDQIYETFNPMTKDFPQIVNFTWKELGI